MKKTALIFLCAFMAVCASCSMNKAVTKVIGNVAAGGMASVEDEQDARFMRDASPALIKTLEVLHHGDPTDKDSLVLLSKAYGQFAFGFLEEELLAGTCPDAKERLDLFYARGRRYGQTALERKASMRRAFSGAVQDFHASLKKLGKRDIHALFWTAFNWANWLNLHRDDVQAIADMPRMQKMIERVVELDDTYYYGSAHAFRAVFAASRPKMLGGDHVLAEREFRRAIEIAPDYLMTKVLFAQYYARQIQDRALFRKLLAEVLEAEGGKLPEQALENELAKRRAKILLGREKELF